MARARAGAAYAAGRRDRHQQRLDRAAGAGGPAPVPAGRRCRAGHRPEPAGVRTAARRPAQGGTPRLQDGDDAGLRGGRPAAHRGRIGGRRQPVRASCKVDTRSPRCGRRARPANRSRWVGDDRVRGVGDHDPHGASAARRRPRAPRRLARGAGRVRVLDPGAAGSTDLRPEGPAGAGGVVSAPVACPSRPADHARVPSAP